jgi:hypothetical protein
MRTEIDPTIAAVSVLAVTISVSLFFAATWLQRRARAAVPFVAETSPEETPA